MAGTTGFEAILVRQGGIPYTAIWIGIQLAIIVALPMLVAFPGFASAQPSPLEEELWQAQKRNQEAQAAYYQKQLQEQPLIRQLTNNLAAMAAFTAAMVAFISFLFNYRSTLGSQIDTQFYEALKRFGDKDSPTLRSSAAGILGQLGQRKTFPLRRRPYYRTAFNQLIRGYSLEDNPVAFEATTDAVDTLVLANVGWARPLIFNVNRKLKEAFLKSLADFFVGRGAKEPSSLDDNLWKQAASISNYNERILRELVADEVSKFYEFFNSSVLSLELTADNQKNKNLLETLQDLFKTASRLRGSTESCAYSLATGFIYSRAIGTMWFNILNNPHLDIFGVHNTLRKHPSFFLKYFTLESDAFLVNAPLSDIKIGEAVIMKSKMHGALLEESFLANVRLENVNLSGSRFQWVTILRNNYSACNFEKTSFRSAKLHKTEIYSSNLKEVDFIYTNLNDVKFYNVNMQDTRFVGPR
jgi:hypothetical protein